MPRAFFPNRGKNAEYRIIPADFPIVSKTGLYKISRFTPNYKQPAPLAVIGTHAVSIDELERLTGIDFFPNLPDKVENAVEATAQKTAWGFPAG